MLKAGFIGWRGMVGSVLIDRMREEKDFRGFEPVFFSTSQTGSKGPDIGVPIPVLQDANDISLLKQMDIIVTCQGGDYTSEIFPRLRKENWKGYWIDSASTLRMEKNSIIILDPVNRKVIDKALTAGLKDYIGGNCTASLMLMAVIGLFEAGLVEWISTMTYQAASGAGAKHMRELLAQMGYAHNAAEGLLENAASAILEIDRKVSEALRSDSLPSEHFGAALAGSLIPWIDRPVEEGQTREEWKGYVETNKILDLNPPVPVDGLCVRIGAMRCHGQGLTIKLKKDVPLNDLEGIVKNSNKWVKFIPNTKEETLKYLTPAAVNGTLAVPIGRMRKMKMGGDFLAAFTVGDQLLWGAAEPLRRMLRILLDFLG
jgi:aspartate-semialdehyde dehydrogenase